MKQNEKAPAVESSKGRAECSTSSIQRNVEPAKILIRIFGDGYCELYSDQRLHLHVQKVLAAPSMAGERAAIELADLSLPFIYRGLDDARKLVATFDTRPISVARHQTAMATLSALKIMDAYSARVSR